MRNPDSSRKGRVVITQVTDSYSSGFHRLSVWNESGAARIVFLVSLLVSLLTGCSGGGSGGSGGPQAPQPTSFALVFPGENSLTDASEISIVGHAPASRLSAVTIKNGISETQALLIAGDQWRAPAVPLDRGDNSLTVVLTGTDGAVTERPLATVHSSPVISHPTGALFDAASNRVLVLDAKQLLAFDVATGALDVLSSSTTGTGPRFGHIAGGAMSDAGEILVAGSGGVLKVDPTTGDRSEQVVFPEEAGPIASLAIDNTGDRLFAVGELTDFYEADLSMPAPIDAVTIKPLPNFGFFAGGSVDSAYAPASGSVFTVSLFSPSAIEIDVSTGDRTPVNLAGTGLATTLAGIGYDNAGAQLLLLGATGAVFTLDPVSKSSSVLHPPSMTSTLPVLLSGMTVGSDTLWTVGQTPGQLRGIEIATGSHSTFASSMIGGGVAPGAMFMGRYDATSDRFVAIAGSRVIGIDPGTGERQQLAALQDPVMFPPQSPKFPAAMTLSQDGTVAWIADMFDETVSEVNLSSGIVNEVSGPDTGSGPLPAQISGIAVDSQSGVIYMADRFALRIIQLNPVTGIRTEIADLAATLSGSRIRSMVLDEASNRLLLNIAPLLPTSPIPPSIYALDLTSLQPTILADLSDVESPFGGEFGLTTFSMQMSLSADGQSLYSPVNGNLEVAFARVDLISGSVTAIGSATSGVPFFVPSAIDETLDGRLYALDGTSALMVLDPESGDRAIVSK